MKADLSRIRAVLYDLDGTLVDSAPDLAVAVNRVLADLGQQPREENEIRRWVGNGARRLIMRALTGEHEGDPGDEHTDPALEQFFEYYGERVAERSRLYPGVAEGIAGVAELGIAQAVVTNKPRRFAEPLLETLGIRRYMATVVGGECAPVKKPDPAPLRLALERLGVEPAQALMVGDSAVDVGAARNTGMKVICVPYGYNAGNAIEDAFPDAMVKSLAEIPAMLRSRAA
ncbi:phosphoglycolate phosphatase [Alkalilimnicola ehrlichii MLHE-1]|uniref:Phosphoglycolate phosphatase n=1 Tax=Alkalilimnicola ehrlichii (strain ATCC BAA-1101 / DSM 17681 / MLHE-1) TaxID=187272 RepID=Q0A6E4_ALKEH|nr:phosphoglycolate phosphatase [Alkalilimnicola ehrlichii]ABI57593.1 phosphoglycolate phosphatase [Alkalilimnicola ehrlichii MLHE-1]